VYHTDTQVFNMIGISTCIDVDPIIAGSGANRSKVVLDLPDCIKRAIDRLPAGTGKHGLCHSFVKRYSSAAPFAFIPQADLLLRVVVEVEGLVKDYENFKKYGCWGQDEDFYALLPISPGDEEAHDPVGGTSREQESGGTGPEKKAGRVEDIEVKFRQDPRIFYHMKAGLISGDGQPRKMFVTPEQTSVIGSVLLHHFPGDALTRTQCYKTFYARILRRFVIG